MRTMQPPSLRSLWAATRPAASLAVSLVMAFLLVCTVRSGTVQAQTPTPPLAPRDALIQDIQQPIQHHNRLVVVGAPGAGKTMLLNHLTLTYAWQGLDDFADRLAPILFQLNRLNDSAAPLIEHLANVLERNNFPSSVSFVKVALKRGQLLLLFDGLDEVFSFVKVQGRGSNWPSFRLSNGPVFA